MSKNLIPSTIIPPSLYVRRSADRQVEQNIESMGRPGYVLVARQMGKTNLLIHTKKQMESTERLFGYVDLSNKASCSRDCFRSIIDSVASGHNEQLTSGSRHIGETRKIGELSPHKEFEASLIALLEAFNGKIIFILDEIDALIDTSYSDEVFAQIRSIYFARVNHPEFERVTFLLSGVAEPSTIIKDRTKSPFNIGEKIYLDNFSESEYHLFLSLAGLHLPTSVRDHVYHWLAGHPRMTWDVCSFLEDRQLASKDVTTTDVLEAINKLYLERYDTPPVDHLRDLIRSDKSLLRALKQFHHDPKAPIADLVRKKLYLAGITVSDSVSAEIQLKNKVIEQAISSDWLESIESLGYSLAFLGDEQKQLGNFRAALGHYNEVLKRDDVTSPQVKAIVLRSIGECHQSLEEWESALSTYRKCEFTSIENPDEYWTIQLNIGFCLLGSGDLKGSQQAFIKILREGKKGFIRWKAMVNYAATIVTGPDMSLLNEAQGVLEAIISETNDFDESQVRELRTIAFWNRAEVSVLYNDFPQAEAFFNKARGSAAKDFQPFLLLRLYEIEPDVPKKLSILKDAAKMIIEGRFAMGPARKSAVMTTAYGFERKTLDGIIIGMFLDSEFKDFTEFAEFSRSHYIKGLANDFQLLLVAIRTEGADQRLQVRILEKAIRWFQSTPDRASLLEAHRNLSICKYLLGSSFFNDFSAYCRLFEANGNFGKPLGSDDIFAFIMGIVYLRQHREPKSGLRLCKIVEPFLVGSASINEGDIAAVHFLRAQLHELLDSKEEAMAYAKKSLSLLVNWIPPQKKGALAAKQIEEIRSEAKAIIERGSALGRQERFWFDLDPPLAVRPNIRRNENCSCGSGKKYKHCCGKTK